MQQMCRKSLNNIHIYFSTGVNRNHSRSQFRDSVTYSKSILSNRTKQQKRLSFGSANWMESRLNCMICVLCILYGSSTGTGADECGTQNFGCDIFVT